MSSSIFAPLHGLPRTTGAQPSRSLVARLRMAMAISRQRRALARLDEARLADLGLTRKEALSEAARPMWDAPRNWMC
ncbi:DUF1127 domain-containing protein [Celeribacter halophilus]|uniref:DUF1127 domain-containing protein n=1 Tax=Celeribacter halophilus TaxID=576117 RepID=UPI002FD23643